MPSGILYVSTRYQDPLDSTTLHSTQPSRHTARGIPFFFFFRGIPFFFLLGCLPNMPTPPQIPGDQFPFQFLSLDPAILGGSPRECSWNEHKEVEQEDMQSSRYTVHPQFPISRGWGLQATSWSHLPPPVALLSVYAHQGWSPGCVGHC